MVSKAGQENPTLLMTASMPAATSSSVLAARLHDRQRPLRGRREHVGGPPQGVDLAKGP